MDLLKQMIEIPLLEYKELLAAKSRIESTLIYIEVDGFSDKRTVKSLLRGKAEPCITEESDRSEEI